MSHSCVHFLSLGDSVLCLLSLQMFVLCCVVSAHAHECHQCESLWEELVGAKSSLTTLGSLQLYGEVTQELWPCEVYKQIQSVQCTGYERLKQPSKQHLENKLFLCQILTKTGKCCFSVYFYYTHSWSLVRPWHIIQKGMVRSGPCYQAFTVYMAMTNSRELQFCDHHEGTQYIQSNTPDLYQNLKNEPQSWLCTWAACLIFWTWEFLLQEWIWSLGFAGSSGWQT